MTLWGRLANQALGAVTGLVTGLISSPFLGAWYTYQTTLSSAKTLPFVFSLMVFLPRLILNSFAFLFLSVAGGVFHGARSGFNAGWIWPKTCLNLMNRPISFLNLFRGVFAPYPPIAISLPESISLVPVEPKISLPDLLTSYHKSQDLEIKEIDLSGNQLFLNLQGITLNTWSGKSFVQLSCELNSKKYSCLNICHNNLSNLSPICIARLMQTLKLSPIHELYLSYTHVGLWNEKQMQAFADGLVNSGITILHLCKNELNRLSPESWTILLDAIAKSSVQTIALGYNNLSDLPFDLLSPLLGKLKDSKVSLLSLDNNHLGDWTISGHEWIQFIQHLNIENLNLNHNDLQRTYSNWSGKETDQFLNLTSFKTEKLTLMIQGSADPKHKPEIMVENASRLFSVSFAQEMACELKKNHLEEPIITSITNNPP